MSPTPGGHQAAPDGTDLPSGCPAEDGGAPRILTFDRPPPDCLDRSTGYLARLRTTEGTIVVQLDPGAARSTVNNFVFLARHHYYDGSLFHRVIADFVIQAGDPTGDPPGTGGPGYTIDEEQPPPGSYQVGSLAMAKRAAPSTTGGQFFIVVGSLGTELPNEYSLFGHVIEGMPVVAAIANARTDINDRPITDVVIESVTIEVL